MRRYFTYSFLIHVAILVMLVIVTYALPSKRERTLRFIVLPKGTSLDAVLTPELEQQRARGESPLTPEQTATVATPSEATPAPEASPSPTATPGAPPEAPRQPTPEPTPPPTPEPTSIATPTATPPPTPEPQKTIAVTPKPATPSPTARPSPSRTPKPRRSPTPMKTAKTAKPTLRAAPQSPTRVASAYAAGAGAALSGQPTPAGLTPRPARPSEEVGIAGVPEGVEGAPLPLDREQSLLSMLYATRARMKIQSNFTVPPDVNDPNLTCVVEWEILPDGTIRNIRVVKSTGEARLDVCAVDALKKTVNLGPLPPEWGNRSVWTSLTFVFAGDLPAGAVTGPDEPASADPRRR